jgi:hypothetical protein
MSNMLTTPDTNPFANYEPDVFSRKSFPGVLGKFVDREFLIGKDKLPWPTDRSYVPVMNYLTRGWQKFRNRELVAQKSGLFVAGYRAPLRYELGDLDESTWEIGVDQKPKDPWQQFAAVPFVSVDMKDIYTFISSSRGGRTALDNLSTDHGATPAGKYPLVTLATSFYVHPVFNRKIWEPVFRVTDAYVDAGAYDRAVDQDLGVHASRPDHRLPREEEPLKLTEAAIERAGFTKESPPIDGEADYAGHDPDDSIPF